MAILRESHFPFPNLLSAFRIACVPLLLALAWHGAVEFFLGGFAIALVCMLLPTAIAVAKYRAMPGYHTWSVKLGAVAMGISVTLLLLFDVAWPFRVAALFQMLSASELQRAARAPPGSRDPEARRTAAGGARTHERALPLGSGKA